MSETIAETKTEQGGALSAGQQERELLEQAVEAGSSGILERAGRAAS